ncbi:hypothetical protein [Jannaschia aquimarina]|uniref:Uncharacterized protein n=1 Tax=Jannaschia aquimarina TaxID=935700 RepID=A0A0D1DBG4_9RHOB|nr:hypothetical protein [Jannaschia aquimarina]KIT17288.1 hypothetical protein jaqu_10190 [Jannaschia aquimarina]SNT19707.1 hypothetical protein SAMN05421775_107145 [Jannaschia aquimarina]
MVLTLKDRDGIAEEVLPVGAFAQVMRLPTGWETVPGRVAHMANRLRAAIDRVEQHVGRITLSRVFEIEGTALGGRHLTLPRGRLAEILSVQVDGAPPAGGAPQIQNDIHAPAIVLKRPVVAGARITGEVRLGHDRWEDVPGGLREAVMLTAETLEEGEGPILTGAAEVMMAPYRPIRLRGWK